MALSNVTTAVSDGGTSGGKLDMDINAESFYTAYKTIEMYMNHLIVYQVLFLPYLQLFQL